MRHLRTGGLKSNVDILLKAVLQSTDKIRQGDLRDTQDFLNLFRASLRFRDAQVIEVFVEGLGNQFESFRAEELLQFTESMA